jgi:hypothetical protein
MLLRCILQIRSFFRHDRPFYWADLETDATVNTGGKVNPVPVSTLDIFAGSWMNASNWAGINAISDAFADICNNRVWHSVLSSGFDNTS